MDLVLALRAAGALILVLGMLLGAAWLLRRYGGSIGIRTGQNASDLRVVEWRSLDMRRKLAVVRWDGRDFLLLLGATDDTLIASRDAPPAPAPATAPPAANDESKS
jgi:flagellar protein FliO/FliZ